MLLHFLFAFCAQAERDIRSQAMRKILHKIDVLIEPIAPLVKTNVMQMFLTLLKDDNDLSLDTANPFIALFNAQPDQKFFNIKKSFNKDNSHLTKEIKHVMRCEHPTIVPIRAIYIDNKKSGWYNRRMALAYDSHTKALDSIKTEEAIKPVMYDILCALEELHSKGVASLLVNHISITYSVLPNGHHIYQLRRLEFSEAIDARCPIRLRGKHGIFPYYAPETYNDWYLSQKCDIYLLGMTMMCTLAATSKYDIGNNRAKPENLERFYRHSVDIIHESDFSKVAKDFLLQCTVFNFNVRPTASKLKDHEWFKDIKKSRDEIHKQYQATQRAKTLVVGDYHPGTNTELRSFEDKFEVVQWDPESTITAQKPDVSTPQHSRNAAAQRKTHTPLNLQNADTSLPKPLQKQTTTTKSNLARENEKGERNQNTDSANEVQPNQNLPRHYPLGVSQKNANSTSHATHPSIKPSMLSEAINQVQNTAASSSKNTKQKFQREKTGRTLSTIQEAEKQPVNPFSLTDYSARHFQNKLYHDLPEHKNIESSRPFASLNSQPAAPRNVQPHFAAKSHGDANPFADTPIKNAGNFTSYTPRNPSMFSNLKNDSETEKLMSLFFKSSPPFSNNKKSQPLGSFDRSACNGFAVPKESSMHTPVHNNRTSGKPDNKQQKPYFSPQFIPANRRKNKTGGGCGGVSSVANFEPNRGSSQAEKKSTKIDTPSQAPTSKSQAAAIRTTKQKKPAKSSNSDPESDGDKPADVSTPTQKKPFKTKSKNVTKNVDGYLIAGLIALGVSGIIGTGFLIYKNRK